MLVMIVLKPLLPAEINSPLMLVCNSFFSLQLTRCAEQYVNFNWCTFTFREDSMLSSTEAVITFGPMRGAHAFKLISRTDKSV